MRSVIVFLGLICYSLLGSAVPLSESNDHSIESLFHTDIFEAFKPLPEYPKNVIRNYTFELKKIQLAPDGFTRPVWSVNGQYPGPMIRANIGDTFNITVINRLGDLSAIHWHGMFQRGTNWFDGVPGTTQCPIPDGFTFSYVFTLEQSGTYWYHSHLKTQHVDGLKGPLIIHDPNDPNKGEYDYEYVMTVSDWYHTPTGDPGMLPLLLSANYTGFDPIPDSGDISGVGQFDCTIPKCIPPKFATYKVQKGKKYRFRIINMSAMTHFSISIDKHPLTIIEVDGTPIHPATVETLSINVAQRYSVIVSANQPIGNYWIRASLSNCSFLVNNVTINAKSSVLRNEDITGILRYDGAPSTIPTSKAYNTVASCHDVDSNLLKPYPLNPSVPQDANIKRINIAVNIQVINSFIKATINNSSYVADFSHPTNKRVINGVGSKPSDNIYQYYNLNEPIEILLNNTLNQTHPFHLHGHLFWIVAQGEVGSYNKSLDSLKYNFDNPPYRDTATVRELGLMVIRYYADNPGVWLFHCHIEWHIELGMVAQLVEVPKIFKKSIIPNNVLELCNAKS